MASTNEKLYDADKNCDILSFNNEKVTLRRQDGAHVHMSISSYSILIWNMCYKGQWDKATKVCRMINEKHLWATIAGMGLSAKELLPVQTAFAQLEDMDKVL